ncbi:MAG: hypothetical protein SNJ82_04060 [Gemmataceae bacterium]
MRSLGLLILLIGWTIAPLHSEPDGDLIFDGKSLNGWVVEGATTFKQGDKVLPVWVPRTGYCPVR